MTPRADTGFEELPFVPVTVTEVATYDGDGQSADYAGRVVVSKSGRIYVMGHSIDVGVQNHLLIRCYKSDGTLLWQDDRELNGFVAQDLIVDANDNAYAIGMVYNDGGFASSQDVGIFKYDASGSPARDDIYELDYLEPLSGTTFNQNRPTASALAPNGRIYISGYVSRGVFAQPRDESHPVMFALDPAGQMNLAWESSTHTEASLSVYTQEIPVSLAVNSNSEVYEVSNYGSQGNGVTLRKVSASGSNAWRESATIESFGSRHHNAVHVGLDQSGTPYVVGNVDNSGQSEIFVAKFNPADGSVTRVLTYAFGQHSEVAAARVLSDGSVVGVGSGGFDEWVIFRVDPSGKMEWQQRHSSGSARGLALDPADNVYVVGQAQSFDADPELFAEGDLEVAKFSGTGQFIWSKALTDAHGLTREIDSQLERPSGIAVDGSGTLYVTGHRNFDLSEPVDGRGYPIYDAVLFKIQPSGVEPPSVRFLTPTEGQSAAPGTPFPKVTVEASSPVGIQKVVLYNARHQILGVLTNAPYEISVNSADALSVVPLYAVAYDNLGYASYNKVSVNADAEDYTIEFTQPEFRVSEKEGPVQLQNELTPATVRIAARRTKVSGPASVTVILTPGSASTSDFQNSFGTHEPITLYFEDGDSVAHEEIIITKDVSPEPDESFMLTLSDPTVGTLGAQSTAKVIIIDDDSGVPSSAGVIQVNPVDSLVTENGGAVDITLTRSVSTEPTAISYYTQPNTAQEGVDYLGALGTIYFAPGESTKKLRVYALKDAVAEPQETFYVTFHHPENGATLGSSYFAFVRIQDEGGTTSPATVTFDSGVASVREDAGSLTLSVRRSGPSSGTATISYATVDGTALSASDFVGASGTLTFAAGETLKTIQIPLVADSVTEGDESFAIELSSPTGAVLGVHPKLTVTISEEGGPAPSGETLSTWASKAFTAAELSDPQISGEFADPDSDGYPNLVEYALGLDPKQGSAKNLLKPEVTIVNGQPALQVTFTRPKGRRDLDYLFEAFEKIGSTPCSICADVTVADNGDGTESVRVRVAGSAEKAKSAFLSFKVGKK